MAERKVYLYYCSYSWTDKIYIGSTVSPYDREKAHKRHGTQKEIYCYPTDGNVTFNIIDETNEAKRLYWEKFYIDLFLSWGFNLHNKVKNFDTNKNMSYLYSNG